MTEAEELAKVKAQLADVMGETGSYRNLQVQLDAALEKHKDDAAAHDIALASQINTHTREMEAVETQHEAALKQISDSYVTEVAEQRAFATAEAHAVADDHTKSCPYAIFRRIRAIVLFPFDGMFGSWFTSHIDKKVLESIIIHPSFANSNTATTIPVVGRIFSICASLFHGYPCLEFRRTCVVMLSVEVADSFIFDAPARSRVTTCKFIGRNFNFLPANASALPISFPLTTTRTSYNGKSIERFSDHCCLSY